MQLESRHERDIKIYARHKLEEHGFLQIGWRFIINGRMKKTLGCCYYTRKTIEISKSFCKTAPLEDIQDTILHEIAHALAGHGAGHGDRWKAEAIRIGAIPSATKKVRFADDANGMIPVSRIRKEDGTYEFVSRLTMTMYNKIKSGKLIESEMFLPSRKSETLGKLHFSLVSIKEYNEMRKS